MVITCTIPTIDSTAPYLRNRNAPTSEHRPQTTRRITHTDPPATPKPTERELKISHPHSRAPRADPSVSRHSSAADAGTLVSMARVVRFGVDGASPVRVEPETGVHSSGGRAHISLPLSSTRRHNHVCGRCATISRVRHKTTIDSELNCRNPICGQGRPIPRPRPHCQALPVPPDSQTSSTQPCGASTRRCDDLGRGSGPYGRTTAERPAPSVGCSRTPNTSGTPASSLAERYITSCHRQNP